MSKPKELHVGDVVQPINVSHTLACGSGRYSCAVVINMNPFVLSTGDMRWQATVEPQHFEFVRRATPEEFTEAVKRLTE